MKVTKLFRSLMVVSTVGLAVCAPSAAALDNGGGYTISDVTVRQRWPWSRKVDIDFYLAKPEGASSAHPVSIGLVASNGTDAVTLSGASLCGDYDYLLPEGYRRIVWDPTVDHSGEAFSQLKFYLSVSSTNPVASYMVVDLVSGAAEYKGASFASSVNAEVYKTDKLALRFIPAGSFSMGQENTSATTTVTLTQGFYAGVFEVTVAQWNRIMNGSAGTDVTAKAFVSYYEIRENPAPVGSGTSSGSDDPAVDWPANNTVRADSFMGRLRSKTGLSDFDLPTDAQWEYLCRAGTTTYYNDGNPNAPYDGVSQNATESNLFVNALGWYKYNCIGVQSVGQKTANGWGVYDMHGNLSEWCLDWYTNTLSTVGVTDPAGPASGSSRVYRGGSWYFSASYCRSANREFGLPSYWRSRVGFRLVRTLP